MRTGFEEEVYSLMCFGNYSIYLHVILTATDKKIVALTLIFLLISAVLLIARFEVRVIFVSWHGLDVILYKILAY